MTQADTETPIVSIIILYLPGSPWLSRCMDALADAVSEVPAHEVILLCNGVGASADSAVRGLTLRSLRSGVNLGFAGGCNWAAQFARGRHLIFLNDDAIVEPGWLRTLVDAVESDDTLGAVGSVVIDADGAVVEAGRVLWSDGASHPVAEAPAGRLVPAGYCSASSLLVRRQAWDAAGGFDERFYPAYYEDADLALALQCDGWAVACAGGSRIHHRGSASTGVLFRRFLGVRNHAVFTAKWANLLPLLPHRPADEPAQAQIRAAAAEAGSVAKRLYHTGRVHEPTPSTSAVDAEPADQELLRRQVDALQREVELKNEYIAFLERSAPELERGLQRVLHDEQVRARRREKLRALPVVGPAAVWANRQIRGRRTAR